MLSNSDIPDFPAFDMLVGQRTPPFLGFGDVIQDSRELEKKLHADAAQVQSKIRDAFRVKLRSSSSIPKELDAIIEKMWNTGWDPSVGNLNLFTRDFGLLLVKATLDLLGGRLIFRSSDDDFYVHNSILWPGVEAFPFHKAFKCMTETDGESMAYFVRGLGGQLEEEGLLLSPETKERLQELR
jgi:hypothetical protein